MIVIRDIVENIRDELEDVKKYAEAAARTRMDDPEVSAVYADLGAEEIKHAERLHRTAVDLIEKERARGREAPPAMRAIWDYEHKIMMEDMAKARHMLEISRG